MVSPHHLNSQAFDFSHFFASAPRLQPKPLPRTLAKPWHNGITKRNVVCCYIALRWDMYNDLSDSPPSDIAAPSRWRISHPGAPISITSHVHTPQHVVICKYVSCSIMFRHPLQCGHNAVSYHLFQPSLRFRNYRLQNSLNLHDSFPIRHSLELSYSNPNRSETAFRTNSVT